MAVSQNRDIVRPAARCIFKTKNYKRSERLSDWLLTQEVQGSELGEILF